MSDNKNKKSWKIYELALERAIEKQIYQQLEKWNWSIKSQCGLDKKWSFWEFWRFLRQDLKIFCKCRMDQLLFEIFQGRLKSRFKLLLFGFDWQTKAMHIGGAIICHFTQKLILLYMLTITNKLSLKRVQFDEIRPSCFLECDNIVKGHIKNFSKLYFWRTKG